MYKMQIFKQIEAHPFTRLTNNWLRWKFAKRNYNSC